MADPLREGKKRSPAKNYEADIPVPARGGDKDRKRANVRPDGIATQSRHSKRKKTGQAHPTLASVGFPEQNPQDPFQRLSSVEVGLVIDSLPVESTHTLRLVSKLWKACSEYHNGVLAIRRHFPHSALAKRTYDTREEANLQFRRLLYHRESLKKGLATRATKFTSATFWHLNANMLLWANSNTVSLLNLRSAKNASYLLSDTLTISLGQHLRQFQLLCGAWMTAQGDFIVRVEPYNDRMALAAYDSSTHPVGLVRLSRKGRALWEAPHTSRDIVGNLVVGTTVLYYIFGSPSRHKHAFVARSIEDGSVLIQEDVPFTPTDYTTCRLHLFGNAEWAAFEDQEANVWIIDTNSGKIVDYINYGMDSRVFFSPTEARIWEILYYDMEDFWLASETTYDSKVKAMIRKNLWLNFRLTSESFFWGFDTDCQLCFRAEVDEPSPAVKLSVGPLAPRTAQAYLEPDGTRHPTRAGSSLATVTLPARSNRKGLTRRDLDIPRRYRMSARGEGFCGMTGDYLLIHAPRERELILVDFWPTW